MRTLSICFCFSLAACAFSGAPSGSGEPDDSDSPDAPDTPDKPADDGPFAECGPQSGGGPLGPVPTCLVSADDPNAAPLVVIEDALEDYAGVDAIHVRLTFNPGFNDNTFGAGSLGWGDKPHKFSALVGSDHARVFVYDTSGDLVFNLKLDYISEDTAAPCGYSSLGPFGGDGEVKVGDPSAVLGWQTSLDTNLNDRNYCITDDSPQTTSRCDPPASAPDWDFRVVYDVWLASSAFAINGYGHATMESVHASPSKAENTVDVVVGECPEVDESCLDPDGCDGDDPCDELECDDDEICDSGVCVEVVD